jgi:branched-chain amino acid aminotransferase
MQHSDLRIQKADKLITKPDFEKPLAFGVHHTDYMLEVDYSTSKGWGKPYITPYHMLQIDPRNSTLHYAIELFEGMKAFKNKDNLLMFRPDKNMERMNKSAVKVCLPVSIL